MRRGASQLPWSCGVHDNAVPIGPACYPFSLGALGGRAATPEAGRGRPAGGRGELGHGRITRLGAGLQKRTLGADDARIRAESRVRGAWVELAAEAGRAPLPLGKRLEAKIALPRARSRRSCRARPCGSATGRLCRLELYA
jgi:hypothetical protein